MLVSVAARLRLPQLEPKLEPPKRLDWPNILARCGILPALSLESIAALLVLEGALLKAVSAAEPGRKGLVDGVGLDVLEVF